MPEPQLEIIEYLQQNEGEEAEDNEADETIVECCGLGMRKSGGKSLEEGAEDTSEGGSVWDGDTLDTLMETDDDSMASVSQSLEETGEGFESLGLKDLACYGITQGEVRSSS